MQKRQRIAELLGELQGVAKMGEALLAAAEVCEVPAEVLDCPGLDRVRADRTCECERLLTDRERLVEAPGERQSVRERRQSLRALGGGWLGRHELDRALVPGESGVGLPAFVQVAAESVVEARCAQWVALLDQIDRLPCELGRARRRPRPAGELGCPGAESGEVKPGKPGRVRHRGPERERPLEVGVSLREAEDRLGLAGGFDRRGERLGRAARRRPVGCQLRHSRRSAARELLGEARVQLLALPGEDGRVDRLRQQRMAEPEAPCLRLGGQNAALHGRAERVAQGAVGHLHGGAEQRVPDFASGCRGQAQHPLRRVIKAGDALQQQVAQCLREFHALPA